MFSQTTTNNKTSQKASKCHAAQDSIPSFIRKTYDILEESKFPDVIDWNPEGTALVIKKPSDFCQRVLPLYFKHNNITSFVRQLNMYNFHKRRTQNIDHVYAHELFQKGKKHLLKEIRRKNHEQNSTNQSQVSHEKTPLRLPETLDNAQNPTDMNTLSYENQFLKKLYNDAMSKLSAFEAQVKELTNQNQSLWTQLYQQKNISENALKPQNQQMGVQRLESELTLDKLPMTCGGISIPPLKLNLNKENAAPSALRIAKNQSIGVNKFLNLGEESTEPGESSFTSPSAQQNMSESDFNNYQAASMLRITPQVSQIQALRTNNDLRISRHDMSIGQLLDAWNVDVQGGDNGLLGKREPTMNALDFDFTEPALKRHELSVFKMKSLLSNRSNGIFNVNDDFGMDLLTFTN